MHLDTHKVGSHPVCCIFHAIIMESGVTNPRQYYFFTEILAYLQADQKKKSLQLRVVEC